MYTKFGLIILALCCFGAFCVLSNDNFNEQQKAAEPVTKHIETNAEFHSRIDKVKEYVLQRRFDEMLDLEKKK